MRRSPSPVLLILIFLSVSCLDALDPDVGDIQQEACEDADSNTAEDVSLTDHLLDGLLSSEPGRCFSCHDPAGANPIGVTVGGLDLTDYDGIIAGGVNGGSLNVQPGAPCDSVLFQKTTVSAPFGSRMPQDGPPYLGDVASTRLADWIAEGAQND